MSTTEENKAIRDQESRQVAEDAGEAYRAAVASVVWRLGKLGDEARKLERQTAWSVERRREVRIETVKLVKSGRDLGIQRTAMAEALGVSRQTIHEWINKGES